MEYRKRLVAVDWFLRVLSLPSHIRNNNQAIRNISKERVMPVWEPKAA